MADDGQIWEWPASAYRFVFAAAAPLVAIEVIDGLGALVLKTVHTGAHRAFLLTAVDLALVPTFGVIAFLLSRRGIPGVYLAVLSLIISHTWWLNFRGPYIRVGTFDHFEYSYWPWFRLVVVGIVIGAVVGITLPNKVPDPLRFSKLYWLWPLALLIASALSYFLGHYCAFMSMFAPTRWVALLAIFAVVASVLTAAQFNWNSYEKSVYPR